MFRSAHRAGRPLIILGILLLIIGASHPDRRRSLTVGVALMAVGAVLAARPGRFLP